MTVESLLARRDDPIFYSNLPNLLELETWDPDEALLVLSGVDPVAVVIDWKQMGDFDVILDEPTIRHANWFTCLTDLYDYPVVEDFNPTQAELKLWKEGAAKQWVLTNGANERLLKRLDEAEKWSNDETSRFKSQVLERRARMVGILKRHWDSGDHEPKQRRAPQFFIRWAESRGFRVEWVDWARNRSLVDVEPPTTSPPYFDADSEDYPLLLHIAVRAWDHARVTSGGTAKQRISRYVAERYPQVTEGTREAIALVANWQKSGGRPRTGE